MSVLLVAPVLAAAEPAATLSTTQQAAEVIAAESTTGTLLFCRGDCLAVKVFSGGPYTHVAAIVLQEGRAIVYDSMNGAGVRRQELAEFLESQNPDVIHLVQPAHALTDAECRAFVEHLDGEVGRPYGVAHHLTGGRATGLHCAEYVTDALMACNLIHANQPSRVSPASLAEGIIGDGLYAPAVTFALEEPARGTEKGRNWCHQLWIDTKVCTITCCTKMRRLFLCK